MLLRQRADGFLTAGSRAVGKVPAEFDPAQDNGHGAHSAQDVSNLMVQCLNLGDNTEGSGHVGGERSGNFVWD